MIKVIIGVILIVFLLTFIMFFLLKNIVNSVNEKAKSYFVLKMQDYDNVEIDDHIEKQSEQIEKTLENEEANDSLDKSVYSYQDKVPDYQIDDFFAKYKEIDEKFNINKEAIINKFIKESSMKNLDYYKLLKDFRSKINDDIIFKFYNMDNREVKEELKKILNKKENKLLDDYLLMNNKFQLDDFINYIDNEIKTNDPKIYIEVGKKNENYDYMNKYIKTIYNSSIYKGFKIIYQNKMYDFSLN